VLAALDAHVTMDAAGAITGWNPQAEVIFGWPAAEALGRPLADVIIPATQRDAHWRGLERFLTTGEGPILNRRLELTALRRDGREFPVELAVTPIRSGDGWFLSAFIRDITERRRAERRVAAQFAVTRALAASGSLTEAAPKLLQAECEQLNWDVAAMWMTDDRGTVMRCAAFWHQPSVSVPHFEADTRQAALTRGQGLPGRVWASGQPVWIADLGGDPNFPRHASAARDGLRCGGGLPILLRGGEVIGVIEYFSRELRTLDEGTLPAEAVLGDQIGQFIGRTRALEALAESEQRFRELAENVREVFFVTDPATGRALYLSPAYENIVGRTREYAYATPLSWTEMLHPEDRDRMLAVERATRTGSEGVSADFRIFRPDGTIRWIRRRASPVKDASGRVVRVVGIAEDITDLKRTEEQLLQSQKMEAVGRLAAGVAHDFNNVLTAILGYTELLIEEVPGDSHARQDLEEIKTATGRAAALTRQLLAFSRQQILQPLVLDPNELIGAFQKMLERLIGEDIELRTTLAADLGHVRADPGQLEQVLMNLVVNARDAMPGGGTLTIETANVELDKEYVEAHVPAVPGPYVMIAVSDTGTGMSEEVRRRIFEPFFTTKETGKGTGLGLSTAYGIVKQSGGYIWVYSEPGHGTAFKIYLPRVREPVERLAPPPAAERLTGTECILLAEDDAALRRLAVEFLRKLGYTVLSAGNAEEGLAVARESKRSIDLLVSDVVMPGASGRDLARRLAELQPKARVLYISGYTDDAIVHHGMLEPGLAFLQKPFTPQALARKVREVLDRPT
jgi:PAS domain S-box-containing protein